MSRYDIERLKEDVTGFDVAEYLGMDIIKKGAYFFIHCPGHEKRLGRVDKNIGNCILTKNGYRCFACGKSVSVFNMVIEYYESSLNQEISFYDAVGIVAEASGGKSGYLIDGVIEDTDDFKLSQSDYELIGLKKTYYIDCPVNYSRYGKEITESDEVNNSGLYSKKDYKTGKYIFYEQEKISLQSLQKEKPELYYQIIKEHVKSVMTKYQKLLKKYSNYNSETRKMLKKYQGTESQDELFFKIQVELQNRYERLVEIDSDINEITGCKEEKNENKEVEQKTKEIDYFSMFT